MNEILKSKLSVLAQDELMLRAITAIITERIAKELPEVGSTDTDETIGQKYRAHKKANEILVDSLNDILSYKNEKSETITFNKGK